MNGSILVVDDDPRFGRSLGHALSGDGHRVEVFERANQALAELEREDYDLVFTDLVMPEIDGLELMEQIKRIRPRCEVVLITGHPTIGTVQAALRRGARDYLTKPASFDDEVRPLVESVLAAGVAAGSGSGRRGEIHAAFDGFVGEGPLCEVLSLLPRIARSDAPVLIQGESGTGKELAARAIHRLSPRASGPFVAVNCAALPEELLESELFGVARGAYTGASQARGGFFEAARGGTLLLDEVAETKPTLQAKLLRVIQEGSYYRLGDASRPLETDVRVIASSHRDLADEVAEGRFRLDLFYRLNVVPLRMPSLRERIRELPALIEHLGRSLGPEGSLRVRPSAMAALRRHAWPGNVRELRNALEHALVLGAEGEIELRHLPEAIRGSAAEPEASGESSDEPPADGPSGESPSVEAGKEAGLESLEEAEARQIREALRRTGGNRSQAARLLGVSRRVLGYRMRKHALEQEFALPRREAPRQSWLPGFDDA
ncbi:MAG: sigma-54 dependent transcriptional regulator [Myxococcota bacterium]|nr:sigma-54 dependent transcriptional regulator [Myxococcota bacterium]